jgi:hypothetical protein
MTLAVVLLWLFVINLGIAFGAGLYESRVVAPLWASAPPQSLRTPDSGLRFWALVTTGPLTLLTLASLYLAWRAGGAFGSWWLAAAIVALLERLSTFAYFIPTMLRLQRSILPHQQVGVQFARWRLFGYGRLALDFVAWLLAMRALAIAG